MQGDKDLTGVEFQSPDGDFVYSDERRLSMLEEKIEYVSIP